MDFSEQEAADGLRFVWNVWPGSRIEASRVVVPLAVTVTPLRQLQELPVLPYEPVKCRTCACVLNPYCQVDFVVKFWQCPICRNRNPFPHTYQQVTAEFLPAELYQQYPVVEYQLPPVGAPLPPPAFVFVLDTAVDSQEIDGLRGAVRQVLQLIPETSLVGLVSFGANAQVYELSHTEMPKAYVFRGDSEFDGAAVAAMLRLGPAQQRWQQQPPGRPPGAPASAAAGSGGVATGISRFLLPLSDCEFALDSLLDDLQECSPPMRGQRAKRATGAAVAVATGMLEAAAPGAGGRILLLTGGPGTLGPGRVVPPDLEIPLRTHKDFDKGDTREFQTARKFYEVIGDRLAAVGATLDVFACALDQVGLAEMKPAVSDSGGVMVLAETFDHAPFRQSLARLFEKTADGQLDMSFNATFEVAVPKEVAICGAIGSVSGLKREGPTVAESAIGEGGTTAWRACSLNPRTAVTLYFDVAASHAAPAVGGQPFVLQFITRYRHADGGIRVRVASTARRWASGGDQELAQSFDQEAAAAAVAKLAAFKAEGEEAADVIRWVDRLLIRTAQKFGAWTKDSPDSFRLPESFALFPQFMFHLRRSQFLQIFNNTPDETAFFRLCLEREATASALTMVQPALLSYGLDGPPYPTHLDVSSILPERILLLDTYFMVVVFHGSAVAAWFSAGYHEQPEYEGLRQLLEATEADAKELLAGRMPVPRLLFTKQGGSQARFLLAKLNPSSTHSSSAGFGSGEIIFTDDVSLQVFMDHLHKLAVNS